MTSVGAGMTRDLPECGWDPSYNPAVGRDVAPDETQSRTGGTVTDPPTAAQPAETDPEDAPTGTVGSLASVAPETGLRSAQTDEPARTLAHHASRERPPAAGREPSDADSDVSGAGVLDGSPWRVGSRHGIHLYRQPGPAGVGEPVGTMLTPELAAQVAAEHRYCVEVRELLAAAGQSRHEPGRPDDLETVAARLGFVPAADRDLAQGLADMRGAALAGLIAEQDETRRGLARVRDELAAANATLANARAAFGDVCDRMGVTQATSVVRSIAAHLGAALGGADTASPAPKSGGSNSADPREDDTDA